MAGAALLDVLVIGSGASGLAAAVSAERGRRAGRARDQGLAPVVQLGEGAGRHPGRVRRRTTRPSSTPRTSGRALARDRRPAARRGPDERGARRDPLARGARRRVHARERRLPARALRRREPRSGCSRSATARATRSRPRCARRVEAARRHGAPAVAARSSSRRTATRLARALRRARRDRGERTVVLAAGGRCYREARGARRALDEPSRARPAR